MKTFKQILFYYQMVLSILLIILGLVSQALLASPAFLLVLVPVLLYLCGHLLLNYKKNNQSQGQIFWIILSLLLLYNLLSTSLLFISNLLSSKSVYNLLVSLLYLPFPLYYYLSILTWYTTLQKTLRERASITPPTSASVSRLPVDDQQRRRFLKLVGGTSLSLILMSLVNPKQAGAAFFGSVPGPGTVAIKNAAGAKIDPAEKQPTDGYKISQVDDTTYPAYYGFVDATGAWYIMKEDSSSNYRYTKGASAFSTAWTNRASQTYDYYDAIF